MKAKIAKDRKLEYSYINKKRRIIQLYNGLVGRNVGF
jgi:hypothetical protein